MRRALRLAALLCAVLAAGCSRTEPKAPRLPITAIQVDPAQPVVALGRELFVTAQGLKANGMTEDVSDCEWSVADEGLVRLEPGYGTARLTGLKVGETRLLVAARGVVANLPLRVIDAVPLELAVSPAEVSLALGGSERLSAIARMSDGSTHPVGEQAAWSVEAPLVAGIGAGGETGGVVTGLKAGSTRARAEYLGLEAFAAVTVRSASLVRVDVLPPVATLPLHTSLPLQAIALFSDSTTSDVSALAAWSSGAPSVVRMNGASAEAVGAGTATVTATWGSATATAQLTVTTAELRTVEIAPAQLQLAKGTTEALVATAIFSDDSRFDVTQQARWSSSDLEVAATDDAVPGAVKAVSPGTAQVTATLLGVEGRCEVTVTDARLTALAVTPASLSLAKGSSAAFTATGTYSDLSTQDVTALVTWSSSDDAVATLSNAPGSMGLALARQPGRVTVGAELEGQSANAALEVTAAELLSIAVEPATDTLAAGTERQFSATATYSDGTTLPVTELADWSSSDNAVASVTTTGAARGLARAVAPGQATVTAAYGGATGAAKLTVTPATLVFLSIAPVDPSLAKGTDLAMRATGRYSDGRTQDVTALVTWSVAHAEIARVSNGAGTNGLVSALSPGTTTLRAALDRQSASTTLTVTAALLVGFAVNPTAVLLDFQGSQQITATATYSDGSVVDVTATTDWTSADSSIATVSSTGASRGLIRGARAGATTVTASFGGRSATVAVRVREPRVTRLEIRPATVSLPAGRSQQLEAFATFADGTVLQVTARASWSSSTAAVVVGSGAEAGRITARSVGAATVTATLDGVSGTAQVNVSSPLIEQLTISPTTVTLAAGARLAFGVRAFFSDGTSQEVTSQSSFVSSDTAICGLIDNVAIGVAPGGPVTVTARFGGMSAAARVTVTAALLTSLSVNPNTLSLSKDQSGQLRAVAGFSDGSSRDVTSQATWSSSNHSVCTVNAGLVLATGSGNATVTATFDGQAASASVRVAAPELQRIVLTPPEAILRPNLIYPYRAWALYSDGTSREVTTAAVWTSSNPTIAEPTNFGGYWGVWAKGAGTATVRASWSGLTGTTDVQVYNSRLTGVETSPAQAKLPVGVAAKFSGVFLYSDGWATPIQNPEWMSLDGWTASVDANGVVTGLAQGSTQVAMSAYDSFGTSHESLASVLVTGATVRSIELSVPARMVVGLSQRVKAVGVLSDGTRLDLGASVTWSSSDVTLATVVPDLEGAKVTARGAGAVRIGATFGAVSASAQVTLVNSTLSTLTLTVPQPALAIGATSPVSVEGLFADGTRLDLTESVAWGSSAPHVAQVSDGMFGNARAYYAVATAAGTATLTASLNGKTGTKQVNVRGATLSSIALAVGTGAPGGALTVSGPGPHQLRAVGTFSDGSTGDVTVFCTFSPGKLGPGVVATVSNVWAGELTVVSTGTETVTATYAPSFFNQPTVRGSATLTVR